MAYTQEQINNALVAELGARPGTTYEQMLAHATSTYGLTPAQVTEAYNAMSRADNTVLVDTGGDGGPGTLHVDPGTVVDTTWWPDTPVYDPSVPTGTPPAPPPPPRPPVAPPPRPSMPPPPSVGQLHRMNVNFGDGTAAVNPSWQNRVTVGAAGSDMVGAGDNFYASPLIQALRSDSAGKRSNNAGVALIPNGVDGAIGFASYTGSGNYPMNDIVSALRSEIGARPGSSYDALYNMANSAYGVNRDAFNNAYTALGLTVPSSGQNAFNPALLGQSSASQQQVDDYNDYRAYRTSALRNQGDINVLGFRDWLAQRNNPDADLPGLLDDVANVAKAGLGFSDSP